MFSEKHIFFYLHIEIQNNINSFYKNEIFIKITHLGDLIGQVDLLIVEQTDVKLHQLILEIYQVVYLLYL